MGVCISYCWNECYYSIHKVIFPILFSPLQMIHWKPYKKVPDIEMMSIFENFPTRWSAFECLLQITVTPSMVLQGQFLTTSYFLSIGMLLFHHWIQYFVTFNLVHSNLREMHGTALFCGGSFYFFFIVKLASTSTHSNTWCWPF